MYFERSVDAIFKNWTALQMLVSNLAAGRHTNELAQWLLSATIQWIEENQGLESFEIAGFLEDVISREFNAQLDDGSYEEVARNICRMRSVCLESADEEAVRAEMAKLPRCDLSRCQVEDQRGEDSGEEAMDMSEVENAMGSLNASANGSSSGSRRPEPDEDGWCTVPSRNRNR